VPSSTTPSGYLIYAEVGAIGGALAGSEAVSSKARRLTLASVKSVYGHTEGAAGLTGVLLAAACLVRAAAPPVANLRQVRICTPLTHHTS